MMGSSRFSGPTATGAARAGTQRLPRASAGALGQRHWCGSRVDDEGRQEALP